MFDISASQNDPVAHLRPGFTERVNPFGLDEDDLYSILLSKEPLSGGKGSFIEEESELWAVVRIFLANEFLSESIDLEEVLKHQILLQYEAGALSGAHALLDLLPEDRREVWLSKPIVQKRITAALVPLYVDMDISNVRWLEREFLMHPWIRSEAKIRTVVDRISQKVGDALQKKSRLEEQERWFNALPPGEKAKVLNGLVLGISP